MSEYIFRRVSGNDYPSLAGLYKNAFNVNIDVEAIRKRFNTTPLGAPHIGFIAIHSESNELAAYYGVYPVKLIYKDQTILAAQSGDTMTHSQHRLRGLFIQLARLTFEECRATGIRLIFGFPNDNSLPGFINKLNWQKIDDIQRWDLKLKFKTFPLPKICRGSKFLDGAFKVYASRVLKKKITSPPASFTNQSSCDLARVNRDENYLAYKNSRDKFFIRIEDQLLWIKLTDVLWVGEISDFQSVNDRFLKKLKRLAFLLGYNTISFNVNSSIGLPAFMDRFQKMSADVSCILPLDQNPGFKNILFTGADFDTW